MEKNLKKNIYIYIYIYMYNWITLLYTWNFVNQLCFNTIFLKNWESLLQGNWISNKTASLPFFGLGKAMFLYHPGWFMLMTLVRCWVWCPCGPGKILWVWRCNFYSEICHWLAKISWVFHFIFMGLHFFIYNMISQNMSKTPASSAILWFNTL